MDAPKQGIDALFILLGAIMVLAMHAGFAFLELGTCLLYTSPSPRDRTRSRMPSSA